MTSRLIALMLSSLSLLALSSASSGLERLRDVQAMTFRHDQYTQRTRNANTPGLKCVAGACDPDHVPRVAQCKNQGVGPGGDVQWSCEAELPDGVSFDRVEVVCEGARFPGDEFVATASCALEYSLLRVVPRHPPEHLAAFGYNTEQQGHRNTIRGSGADETFGTTSKEFGIFDLIILLLALLLLASIVIAFCACQTAAEDTRIHPAFVSSAAVSPAGPGYVLQQRRRWRRLLERLPVGLGAPEHADVHRARSPRGTAPAQAGLADIVECEEGIRRQSHPLTNAIHSITSTMPATVQTK